jgi:predicted dehydrogenase
MLREMKDHSDFDLVAVASRDPDKAARLATEYGCKALSYNELLQTDEIEAIYIPLPNGLHAEWVARCLDSGKHVLCEKSLGCSLSEVQQMVALASNRCRFLMETFQFRFHSQQAYARHVLESGQLGEVRCFRSSFGFPPFPDGMANIRYRHDLGGGSLLDAGAYTLKATTFVCGQEFRVRAATLRTSLEFGVDIAGGVFLDNGKGTVSQTAFGFDHFYRCDYEVWGSRGRLLMKRAFTAPPGFRPEAVLETTAGTEIVTLPPDNHFSKMLSYFANGIRTGSNRVEEYEECLVQAELLCEAKRLATVVT